MWLETLPLILEYISNEVSNDEDIDVEIFSEQVGEAKVGSPLFEGSILDLNRIK